MLVFVLVLLLIMITFLLFLVFLVFLVVVNGLFWTVKIVNFVFLHWNYILLLPVMLYSRFVCLGFDWHSYICIPNNETLASMSNQSTQFTTISVIISTVANVNTNTAIGVNESDGKELGLITRLEVQSILIEVFVLEPSPGDESIRLGQAENAGL